MATVKAALSKHSPVLVNMTAKRDRERADHLSSVFTKLPAAVLVLDGEGRISEANDAAHEMLQPPVSGHSLVGILWRDVVEQCFKAREDDGHEVSTRNGQRVNISTCPLDSEPGQIILIKDITESRSLQSKMARNDRLASLGEMTASLAHQFRTPVASALLYASHLGGDQLEPESRARFADKLISRLAHLETLVQDMLVFARGGETRQPESLALDDILDTALSAMDGRMRESSVTIVQKVASGKDGLTPYVRCDRDSLITAINNLIDNAVKACDGPGLVTVATEIAGGQIQIKISDDGQGMDQHTLNHVLEPFFTTSPGGTGLGLPVVNAVAQSHGGSLNIESTPGLGSCFTLSLPLEQSSVCSASAGSQAHMNPSWINKHRASDYQRPFLTSVN